MRYEDFVVQIVHGKRRGYTVLASCMETDGKGAFVPPYDPKAPGPDLNQPKPGVDPSGVGERLFESLFPGEVLRLYESHLARLRTETDAGLRLKLKLDPRDPDIAAFQAYPWELMRQPGAPDSPVLSRHRPLVRFLAIPRSIPACPRPVRLRILPLASSTRDGEDSLDLEAELGALKEAVAGAAGVELAEPAVPTLEGLRKALSLKECHGLHFMGHGGFDETTSQGHLFFETETGMPARVTGTDLANVLADFPSVRLVVLNACKSARVAGADASPRFGGVATTLVMGGLPAVVAMQQEIYDDHATPFSTAFYSALAAGEPVDAAVAEGRKAIHDKSPGGFEWAIPVLYMRTPEGVLFPEEDIPPPKEGWRRAASWLIAAVLGISVLTGGWWLRVDHLVDQGRQAYESNDLATASDRFRSVLALAPFSAEAHSGLAGAEYARGHREIAEDHFRKAVELRPDDPLHVYNLGSYLNEKGRFEEAHGLLRQAVDRHVESPELLGELGLAALRRSFLTEARGVLDAAIRTQPDNPFPHRLLGEVALRQGRPREAVGHLQAALDLYPRGAEPGRLLTLSLSIQAHAGLGDLRGACRAADELRLLDPQGIGPGSEAAAPVLERLDCHEEVP